MKKFIALCLTFCLLPFGSVFAEKNSFLNNLNNINLSWEKARKQVKSLEAQETLLLKAVAESLGVYLSVVDSTQDNAFKKEVDEAVLRIQIDTREVKTETEKQIKYSNHIFELLSLLEKMADKEENHLENYNIILADMQEGETTTETPEQLLVHKLYRCVDMASLIAIITAQTPENAMLAENLLQEYLNVEDKTKTIFDQLLNATQKLYEFTSVLLLNIDTFGTKVGDVKQIQAHFEDAAKSLKEEDAQWLNATYALYTTVMLLVNQAVQNANEK